MFLETKTENAFQCTIHYFKCSLSNFQNELQGYVNPDLQTIFNTEHVSPEHVSRHIGFSAQLEVMDFPIEGLRVKCGTVLPS